MATIDHVVLDAIDTKTSFDLNTSNTAAASKTLPWGNISLQLAASLENLQLIELLPTNNGGFLLKGFQGSFPKKINFPHSDTIITLNYSIRVNSFNKVVLRIEKKRQEITTCSDSLISNKIINTGCINFKNSKIISFTDNAAKLIPNDSFYTHLRAITIQALSEVGLPVDKLQLASSNPNEQAALIQALASIEKLEKEKLENEKIKSSTNASAISPTSTAKASAANNAAVPPLTWLDIPPLVVPSTTTATMTFTTAQAINERFRNDLEYIGAAGEDESRTESSTVLVITDKDADNDAGSRCVIL